MNTFLRFPLGFALVLGACVALSGCEPSDSTLDGCSQEPCTDASVAARIGIVQRRIAANNSKDWSTWQSLHTDDAVRTAPELTEPLVGSKAMRAAIEELFVTFPDYHLELVEAFGEGDRLMARIHTKGTMSGPMNIDGIEIPPTGKVFEQDWVAVLTFDGNQISAIDEFYDNYGTMIQLDLAQ